MEGVVAMNVIQFQGIIFCLISLIVVVISAVIPKFDKNVELIFVATLILVLGVPHGALDTIFARELYGVRTVGAWLRFIFIYLLLVGAVVLLWYYAPLVFLIGFLLISIAHFSGDPQGDVPWLVRILYGGAIIFIPLNVHTGEIAQLFGMLVGDGVSQTLLPWLERAALPWLMAFLIATIYTMWTRATYWFEFICLALLAYFVSPLISFTVFFCAMHSARHIIRTAKYSSQTSLTLLLGATLLPMIGVVILSAIAWVILREQAIDGRMVQIIFVGLAALTVPHMALVEQVRLKGWIAK